MTTALQSPTLSSQLMPKHPKLSTPLKQHPLSRSHHPTQKSKPTPEPKTPPNQSPTHPNPSNSDPSKKSSSKVSHVICKFYKAGNCSAGTSCQFSHTLPELGQGKPVCQWFVKGNCRFAHKCALAHILPGQPMAMDRKNKRAAQAAAREAAAASASGQIDAAFPASPPPELTLELVENNNHQLPSSTTKIIIDEPSHNNIDLLSSPEISHRARQQRLGSPRALLGDLDLEPSNQSDDLQFGLPDDFAGSDHSPAYFGSSLSPSARHAVFSTQLATHNAYSDHQNHRPTRLSPISQHNGFSSAHPQTPTSIERAHQWPRDQSPTPFGTGSPFSAPGSRSVFLPRIGSFGSEDGGYPRSAPSIATSPRHAGHMLSIHHLHQDDSALDVDGEDDVTELLPSSLHSLLTPAERHRQHIRKHAPHTLYSRSVPMEEMIGGKEKKQMEPSALRNGMALDNNSLSVSPVPEFRQSLFSETTTQPDLSYQQYLSNTTSRPQATPHLSSSYIPPPTPFGTWEYSQAADQSGPPSSQLPPPIALSQHQSQSRGGDLFGHAPGTSLPQGLAAGLSRLHFQPPLPTGLTPCGSPSGLHPRDHPLSPPRSPPSFHTKLCGPLSHRMAGLNFGSTTVTNSSPLSRNVSCSPGFTPANHILDDDDTPFRLEM